MRDRRAGWQWSLNYISGYVSKDHDAVDVGLGEYVRKDATSQWLATYHLLSKSTPCSPEVAIRLKQLPELERSYSHQLLYPPQPVEMQEFAAITQGNCSCRMYGFYLKEQKQEWAVHGMIKTSFLVWHRG